MSSQKYLIIVTLIDGQNFTVPEGLDATVFAEARFGDDSTLKSDLIKLTKSNPEFSTELAWQIDKKNLHQLRVERRSIKLQIFMQTKERKKNAKGQSSSSSDQDNSGDNLSMNKVDLIGYTVIDIRSAQECGEPKFQWLPLLNPKFRKSSYNRPEIQLALTLSRIDDDDYASCINESTQNHHDLSLESQDSEADADLTNSRLYETCLDHSLDRSTFGKDEIIENDIRIVRKDGLFYIFDTHDQSGKSSLQDCDEYYQVTVSIPFSSKLDTLIAQTDDANYFSINLFGSSQKTESFARANQNDAKEVKFKIMTTSSTLLTKYFELNSGLDVKLHSKTGQTLAIATIQLDQLSGFDSKRKSIEGIFALQPSPDSDSNSNIYPTIGVSVILEKNPTANSNTSQPQEQALTDNNMQHIGMAREHFGDDIEEYLASNSIETRPQLTFEDMDLDTSVIDNGNVRDEVNHHFRFTIDLKSFSYTAEQRLIPTLRELVVRYSYPPFAFKDTITTDASISINPTKSIIVSGFCEFNFATSPESLLAELRAKPLCFDILAYDETRRSLTNESSSPERIVATSSLNLADALSLSENLLATNLTTSIPIHRIEGGVIGELQLYLCLEDLGPPAFAIKPSESNVDIASEAAPALNDKGDSRETQSATSLQKIETFMVEMKRDLETWKIDCVEKISDEVRKRETEKFKRLAQRFEARDARREQEFRRKLEDLVALEKRYRSSIANYESCEKKINDTLNLLKSKEVMFESQIDLVDIKIAKAITDVQLECSKRHESPLFVNHHHVIGYDPESANISKQPAKIPTKPKTIESSPTFDQLRRSSLKNASTSPSIPVPVRSSSLVRPPQEGLSSTSVIKRVPAPTATIVNGFSVRGPKQPVAISTNQTNRLGLSREAREKLVSLRREKAELLKKGCRPNDELIQEINYMIEKLAF